ncbi:hypothetical protein FRC17_007810 [Serendipita sp. 399]|nr:hypothetical protein FRC17_007810 [Serendipita sp. 399]
MSQFGNVNILDFTLRYNYYWSSDETPPGVTQALRVTIGSWSDLLYFSSGNHTEWRDADQPLGEPFNQVGTTSVSRSPDGTTGYIPITVDFSFTRQSATGLARLFLIGRTFGLHPSVLSGNSPPSRPPSGAFASAGAATSSPASSSIPSSSGTNSQSIPASLSGIPLPEYTVGQPISSSIAGDPSVGSSSSNGGNGSIQHFSKAEVVGGILGGVAALVISSLLLLALYRRKKNQLVKGEERSVSVWVGGLLDPTKIAGGKSGDESANDGQPRMACEKPGLPGFHRFSAPSEKVNYPDGQSKHMEARIDVISPSFPSQEREDTGDKGKLLGQCVDEMMLAVGGLGNRRPHGLIEYAQQDRRSLRHPSILVPKGSRNKEWQ